MEDDSVLVKGWSSNGEWAEEKPGEDGGVGVSSRRDHEQSGERTKWEGYPLQDDEQPCRAEA